MSYDEWDAARDAYIDTLYQEFAEDPETRRQFFRNSIPVPKFG